MSEYLDGELAPRARSRMSRHTRVCPECEHLLTGLRAVVQGLGRLPAHTGEAGAAQIATLVRGRLDEPSSS